MEIYLLDIQYFTYYLLKLMKVYKERKFLYRFAFEFNSIEKFIVVESNL